jgi:formylglycine-generating enzyme required for sulfatase activity
MKKMLLSLSAALLSIAALANNITVSTATLSGQNTGAQTEIITFSVSWENSWHTSTNEANYDGAWVFVKFRKMGTLDWRHCTISTSGLVPGTGAALSVPADGKGAFIYRNADGIGNVSFAANQIVWSYGADGIANNETVEIKVFAAEMVYIPQGKFYLGSGGSESKAFYLGGTSSNPYQVLDNSIITAGTAAGNLNAATGAGAAFIAGPIPAAYPKGFNAFWSMKYETSQQQYADFLNHIDFAKATANMSAPIAGTHPNLTAPFPERAMGSFNAARACALADWMGLRPMSELEYEKACRGSNTPPVANEYAWGTTAYSPLSSVNNPGLTNESVNLPVSANSNIGTNFGFIRTGLFARTTGSDRSLSGATYYGLMNMSDNGTEFVASATTASGRVISDAVHGDGYLSPSGNTDITAWSPFGAFGTRGSSYTGGPAEARTSDRSGSVFFQDTYNSDVAVGTISARFVRTAP